MAAKAQHCIHGMGNHPEWCTRCTPLPKLYVAPEPEDPPATDSPRSLPNALVELLEPSVEMTPPIEIEVKRRPNSFVDNGGSAAGKARAASMTAAERSKSAKKAVAARWSEGPTDQDRWGDIAIDAMKLPDGESMQVKVPAYKTLQKFARNVRSMLCTRNDTKGVRWHVGFVDGMETIR